MPSASTRLQFGRDTASSWPLSSAAWPLDAGPVPAASLHIVGPVAAARVAAETRASSDTATPTSSRCSWGRTVLHGTERLISSRPRNSADTVATTTIWSGRSASWRRTVTSTLGRRPSSRAGSPASSVVQDYSAIGSPPGVSSAAGVSAAPSGTSSSTSCPSMTRSVPRLPWRRPSSRSERRMAEAF